MNWIYKQKPIYSHDDLPKECVGFVYKITYSNGLVYIGKKLIRSLVRVKPTREQLAIRKNYVRREWKNKPFAKYNGSSKNTVGLTITQKEIVELCDDKINLTYCELKWMVIHDVLCDSKYINDNILGKFYSGKITKGVKPW